VEVNDCGSSSGKRILESDGASLQVLKTGMAGLGMATCVYKIAGKWPS
jgi:hypothetical protein